MARAVNRIISDAGVASGDAPCLGYVQRVHVYLCECMCVYVRGCMCMCVCVYVCMCVCVSVSCIISDTDANKQHGKA
jgi:hypothetical protein